MTEAQWWAVKGSPDLPDGTLIRVEPSATYPVTVLYPNLDPFVLMEASLHGTVIRDPESPPDTAPLRLLK